MKDFKRNKKGEILHSYENTSKMNFIEFMKYFPSERKRPFKVYLETIRETPQALMVLFAFLAQTILILIYPITLIAVSIYKVRYARKAVKASKVLFR